MELSIDNPIVIILIAVLLSIIVASVISVSALDISDEQYINLGNQDDESQNNRYTRYDALEDVSICFSENEGHTVAFREDSNISRVDILELVFYVPVKYPWENM